MSRYAFQGTVRDELGNTLALATVTVYLAGTVTAASIYTAPSGGAAVGSVDSDANGRFLFYVDTADYAISQLFKLVMSRTGSTSITYDNIPCFAGAVHDRAHAIGATADHTSSITAGKMLKADASGLPAEGSNTDTEVASAVTNAHTAISNIPRAAAGGTVSTLTATFTPALDLTTQPVCFVTASGANVVPNPTFAPDGGTPRTITKIGGTVLASGDIYGAGHVLILKYDLGNTRWELLNPGAAGTVAVGTVSAVAYPGPPTVTNVGTSNAAVLDFVVVTGDKGDKGDAIPCVAAGGTVDAITGAYTPAVSSLTDKLRLDFVASGANTSTTPTFKADGTTAHTIVKSGGSALGVGDIAAALMVCQLQYNLANTRWELLNPAVTTRAVANLSSLLYPSLSGGLRDIHRGGWNLPLNQQWGGHLMPLPDGSWGDTATGFITHDSAISISKAAAQTWRSASFKTGKAITVAAVWLKIYKVLNPTANLQVFIYSDNAGVPNSLISNGTATAQSGTLHTSSTDGAWYRFVFATPPSLSANTVYHICVVSDAAVDTNNYWMWKSDSTNKYPHGSSGYADGTPTWTAFASQAPCFMVEPTAGYNFLQTSGQFDGKLVGSGTGSPINQSDYIWRKLEDGSGWFDDKEGILLFRGAAWTKDRTIADFMYGLDHDRLLLRCNVTTGYAQLDHYDSAGTKHTVTGTSDVSGAYHDIAICYRFKNDGSDYLKLYVDGASQGTPITSHSFLMDTNFRALGTATILGGFGLPPTWTDSLSMAGVPSADGYTYAGTATEAAHFVSDGVKLYQQIVGSTDTGNAHIHPAFANAAGEAVNWKSGVKSASNVTLETEAVVIIDDTDKTVSVLMHTYYVETVGLSTNFKVQIDLTQREHDFLAICKASDFYLYCDGQLIVDGTGLLTTAGAADTLTFGDTDATAKSNAEVVWSSMKYYETAAVLPEYTAGSLSELACFSGDQSAILPMLYNSGTPISVKNFCGVKGNYLHRVLRSNYRRAITNVPSTASASYVVIAEMEMFMFSEKVFIVANMIAGHSDAAGHIAYFIPYIDGVTIDKDASQCIQPYDANYAFFIGNQTLWNTQFGLHKIEMMWATDAHTLSDNGRSRHMTVKEVE